MKGRWWVLPLIKITDKCTQERWKRTATLRCNAQRMAINCMSTQEAWRENYA